MSAIRYGLPYWLGEFPKKHRPSYARHRGHLDTEVAIVGGGLTGCATAYALGSAGVNVALFEAGQIGQGSTGGSTAMLMQEPDVDFQDLVKRYGLRAARQIWQITRRATFDLAATVRRLKIRCQLQPQDSIYFATDPEASRRLRREYEARRTAGLETSWLTADRFLRHTQLKGYGAIRTHGNAQVDPYRVCLGFASAALRRRAQIYERSPIVRVRFGRTAVEIKTEGGTARADRVIIATGYATPLYKPLARHVRVMQTYAVATPPLAGRVRAELGRRDAMLWDSQHPYHYLRWTRDDRIVFGGADQPRPPGRQRAKILVQRTAQLMYELSTLYPVISGIQPEYAWDGTVAATADGLPYIGPHRNYPRHLFALGYGGNGLTLGFLASRILLRHCLGEPAKGDELFALTRSD